MHINRPVFDCIDHNSNILLGMFNDIAVGSVYKQLENFAEYCIIGMYPSLPQNTDNDEVEEVAR